MEKVQAGSLTEEFSFSRALHLMRNSGAKVRMTGWINGVYIYIPKLSNTILETTVHGKHRLSRHAHFEANEILGNWTLYDEDIHGA